jgi:hypothetical protein
MNHDLYTSRPPFLVQYNDGNYKLAVQLFPLEDNYINIVPPFYYSARQSASSVLILEGPAQWQDEGQWSLPDQVSVTTLTQIAPDHPVHVEWKEWLDYLQEMGPEGEALMFQRAVDTAIKYGASLTEEQIEQNRRSPD